jgi:hypothetical protein
MRLKTHLLQSFSLLALAACSGVAPDPGPDTAAPANVEAPAAAEPAPAQTRTPDYSETRNA